MNTFEKSAALAALKGLTTKAAPSAESTCGKNEDMGACASNECKSYES